MLAETRSRLLRLRLRPRPPRDLQTNVRAQTSGLLFREREGGKESDGRRRNRASGGPKAPGKVYCSMY